MESTQYLKLKIVNLEYQNLLLRIEQTKTTAKTAYSAELRKFGLDPEVNYSLDDATCSVTPTEAIAIPKEQ